MVLERSKTEQSQILKDGIKLNRIEETPEKMTVEDDFLDSRYNDSPRFIKAFSQPFERLE